MGTHPNETTWKSNRPSVHKQRECVILGVVRNGETFLHRVKICFAVGC